ncbi:hypothetical protein MTR_8g027950 [Medicago truncatula]|uniref:Uncharacterized protein n=1 Tax=Medicago truncatula TaxID=3880 RepID=A0A072TYS9_MEDTR|nr:hypothetical protein MTR_8g027950 [Medicago truncatula]
MLDHVDTLSELIDVFNYFVYLSNDPTRRVTHIVHVELYYSLDEVHNDRKLSSLHVWSMLPFFSSISILLQQDMDSKNLIFNALHDLSKDDVTLFCSVLWSIWKQRNNKVWNEVIDPPVYVVERAKVMLYDWQDARRICNTSCAQPRQEGNVKLIKPAEGRFKSNIDASFS